MNNSLHRSPCEQLSPPLALFEANTRSPHVIEPKLMTRSSGRRLGNSMAMRKAVSSASAPPKLRPCSGGTADNAGRVYGRSWEGPPAGRSRSAVGAPEWRSNWYHKVRSHSSARRVGAFGAARSHCAQDLIDWLAVAHHGAIAPGCRGFLQLGQEGTQALRRCTHATVGRYRRRPDSNTALLPSLLITFATCAHSRI